MKKRRSFIKKSLIIGTGMGALPLVASCDSSASESSLKGGVLPDSNVINLPKNTVLLFQGDSITDAGRYKEESNANEMWHFGLGYANYAATKLLGMEAGKNLKIYNRGISGHKVYELADRWDKDCLDLKPSVVSVLIGVNDYWHTMTHDYKGTIDTYLKDFNALLERTKEALPNVKFIIGEPFFIKGGTAIQESWHEKLTPYRIAAKAISDQHGAAFIPYQEMFNEALKEAPVSYWAADGVHPSMAGNYLMGEAWLKALKSLY